jgi:5-methylcytosine-specific restriction endonuclease McrA
LNKGTRNEIYNKYNGHCAYCGKAIEYKDMQVDHVVPKRAHPLYTKDININDISNYNPSCRRCNHYKRTHSLELFRHMLKTIQERIRGIYICKVAEDYGIIKVEPWDGKFYFERKREAE